jgi:SAM-dependent methyltransferase
VSNTAYEFAHCIVCGHADATLVADADAMRQEVEALWAHYESRLRPDTPPAQLTDRVAFSERPPFRLVRCRECGLVYRNPAEHRRVLGEIYERNAPARDVLRALHDTQRPAMLGRARAIRAALGRGGSGLEVGSYVGAFLSAASESDLQFEGLDVNADANDFVRSLGLTAHDGDLTTFAGTERRSFDAIAIWNAFDQLPDPRAALQAARSLLRSDGVLALRVPNGGFYAAWRASLNRRLAVGRAARAVLAQNNLLTFPYRWGFTPHSLARLLDESGFELTATRGDVLVPTADVWTRPWARLEEMLMKRLIAAPSRLRTGWAPWFEVYATPRDAPAAGV